MFYFLTFIFSFGWFLFHTVPASYFGDCPEILAAVFTYGIPHPTGFPFYMLLATFAFNLGGTAFWVNVVSAFSSSVSLILFLKIIEYLPQNNEKRQPISLWTLLLGALIFLSSSTLLLHSSVARVYPLNLTCLLGILAWTLIYSPRDNRGIIGLGFLLGMTACTHTLFLTVVPFLIIWFWPMKRIFFDFSFQLVSGFVLGLSLYLWIPLVAHLHPLINWTDPESFSSFLNYLTQKSYHYKFNSRDINGSFLFLKTILNFWSKEWPFYFWFPAFIGIIYQFKKNRRLFWALASIAYANILILYAYGNEKDLFLAYRYFLPLYFSLSVWIVVGLNLIIEKFPSKFVKTSLFLIFAVGFGLFQMKWKDLNKVTACYDYMDDLLKPIPRGAPLIINGDNQVFPVALGVYGYHLRPDIVYINWDGILFPKAVAELTKMKKPSTTQLEIKWFQEAGGQLYLPSDKPFKTPLKIEPYGLCYRLSNDQSRIKLGIPPDPLNIFRNRHPDIELKDVESEEILAEYPLLIGAHWVWQGDNNQARIYILKAERIGFDSVAIQNNSANLYRKLGDFTKSENCLKRVISLQPHLPLGYMNLGILYAQMGRYEDSLLQISQCIQMDPQNQEAQFYYENVKNIQQNTWKPKS